MEEFSFLLNKKIKLIKRLHKSLHFCLDWYKNKDLARRSFILKYPSKTLSQKLKNLSSEPSEIMSAYSERDNMTALTRVLSEIFYVIFNHVL